MPIKEDFYRLINCWNSGVYTYVENNPVGFVDPDGKGLFDVLIMPLLANYMIGKTKDVVVNELAKFLNGGQKSKQGRTASNLQLEKKAQKKINQKTLNKENQDFSIKKNNEKILQQKRQDIKNLVDILSMTENEQEYIEIGAQIDLAGEEEIECLFYDIYELFKDPNKMEEFFVKNYPLLENNSSATYKKFEHFKSKKNWCLQF